MNGYIGRLLRVDLSTRQTWDEPLEESLIDKFVGQVGIGVALMYREVPAHVKAYDPENRVIFMTGPFTGTRVQSPANYEVISLNPITGYTIGVANSHGYWGPYLKFAGYDGIVIQGMADSPVYLWVHDGKAEIRDAGPFWGLDTFETQLRIQRETHEKASVASIGPSGENRCAGAAVVNDFGHVASKGNIGAVMGSKNLKAVAVYGKGTVPIHDRDRFRDLANTWKEKSFQSPIGYTVNTVGTAGFVPSIHAIGDLPTRNFTTGIFPEFEKLSGEYIRQNFPLKRNPCYGCSLAHCHTMRVTGGAYAGIEGEEPEYEDFSQLGSNLGIGDPGAVVMLTEYIDRLGFDSNWAGATLGFAMEAYGRGVLSQEDVDGLDLSWGNVEEAKELIRKVAYREGIGDVLALGLKNAAVAIGGEAPQFAVHFKGESNHAHDSRALWGQFLGLAISSAGPRWESEGMDLLPDPELGVNEEDRFDYKVKPLSARKSQMKKLFNDSLGTCMFGTAVGLDLISEAYTALTGRQMNPEQALLVGERIANLERAFNVRHGFLPEFDLDVSPRLLEAPPDGGAAGKTLAPYFRDMVFEYNHLMGWDVETGKPYPQTLQRLELSEMVQW